MLLKNIAAMAIGLLFSAAPAFSAQPAVIAPTEKLSPEQELATFKLPPGFVAQLVAAEPDIAKPMNIAFDARGRLWVSDTVDYPFPVMDGPGHDTVKILSGFDENGRAKTISTFATGLTLPLGVMPMDDGKQQSAIIYSVPAVRRYIDTDGDGKADKVEPMLKGYGNVDTHGMTNNFTRGFDGWIYANHGFRNESSVSGTDNAAIAMGSGNTYRFRNDGTHVEYFAHGQVNPFGLCFDPLGNLFSADCHSRPQYMLLRGAYYPSFGKPDDGLGFGPEMCRHDHGSTAIAGTMVYAATQFPREFHGNLFDGNPVTNAVNRDHITWVGATPTAVEAPDFLVSSDPWFRPVQVTLGPDGAMYVADFYNKIIGHYEVDLKHPGRDRTSGRIWRIVYQGDAGKPPAPHMPDLASMKPADQVAKLADANLTVRFLATNRLADVRSEEGIAALKAVARHAASAEQQAHALWALERLGELMPDAIKSAAGATAEAVRTHAMRIIGERQNWGEAERMLAMSGLADASPFVQMNAADAIGRHPDASFVVPLLKLQAAVPAGDTHLLHTVRMALRDQLAAPGILAKVSPETAAPRDRLALLDAAMGVQSPEAGGFAAHAAAEMDLPRDLALRCIRHAVRLATDEQAISHVAEVASKKFADDLDLQLDLLKSVHEGLASRGGKIPPAVSEWAGKVVSEVLGEAPATPGPGGWTALPLTPGGPFVDPWVPQSRKSGDGKPGDFWCSLPNGETLTGILRSQPFDAPAKLSVWIAGHNGLPPGKLPIKNVVRVCDAATGKTLVESPPPRNDVARKVTWDLATAAGKKVYIEAVDADTASAYAWLAFGRFEPSVVSVPHAAGESRKHVESALDIANSMKLIAATPAVRRLVESPKADNAVRIAAAKAAMAIDAAVGVDTLLPILRDTEAPAPLREACATAIGTAHEANVYPALLSVLITAPTGIQRAIAISLAGSHDSAEALLGAIGAGKASPRLLTDKTVVDRLKAASVDKLDERIATLTKGLPDADAAVQNLVEQRRQSFAANASKFAANRGNAVFAKNCAACHRIGNEGAQVGPQLDGAGKRGLDRLVEDVLDPNRNVDGAFRYSVLTLDDGDVVTGLQRRVDGASIVFVDAQGKEFTVASSRIKKRVESQLSLMPANFGEVITESDLGDLLAFLLSR